MHTNVLFNAVQVARLTSSLATKCVSIWTTWTPIRKNTTCHTWFDDLRPWTSSNARCTSVAFCVACVTSITQKPRGTSFNAGTSSLDERICENMASWSRTPRLWNGKTVTAPGATRNPRFDPPTTHSTTQSLPIPNHRSSKTYYMSYDQHKHLLRLSFFKHLTMNQTCFLDCDAQSVLWIACTCASLVSMLMLCMAPCVYIELYNLVENTNKNVQHIKECVHVCHQCVVTHHLMAQRLPPVAPSPPYRARGHDGVVACECPWKKYN